MTELKIEKGHPIPRDNRRKRKYPFDEMEPGDSFFVQTQNPNGIQSSASQANRRAKTNGTPNRYTARMVEGGVRVWRIDGMDEVAK